MSDQTQDPANQQIGVQPVVTGSQPNRFLWFFRIVEDDGTNGNLACEYGTASESEAIAWAEGEYGYHVLAARRRELTFEEYCGLLLCNREGSDHLKRVYKAMQDLFFRCDPRSQ